MEKQFGESAEDYVAHAKEIVFQYGGDENYLGWDILDDNFQIILSAVTLCYQNLDINNYTFFQNRLNRYVIARGHKDADLVFEKQMIELVKLFPGNDDLLWALANRVLHMIYQGRIENAENTISLLADEFLKVNDNAGIAHMERHKGEIEEFRGNYLKAELYYNNSFQMLRRLQYIKNETNPFKKKPNRILAIRCKIGSIKRLQKELEESERYLCSVLRFGDRDGLFKKGIDTKLLFEIANLEFEKENHEYARRIYLKVIENQNNKEKYYRYIALSKLGLGRIYLKLGEIILAKINLEQALKKFIEIDDLIHLAETKESLNRL